MISKKGRPASLWRRISCKLGFHRMYESDRTELTGYTTKITNTCCFCNYCKTELKIRSE